MTTRRTHHGLSAFLAVTCLASVPVPTLAQGSSSVAKWRPRDGVYAPPGKDFAKSCTEYREPNVQLEEKQILGYDWACGVNNIADVAPGMIRIEMTCSDDDLTGGSQEEWVKEVMLLKKIDEKSMLMQKTSDGKFTDPVKVVYCPKKAQQMFLDEIAKKEKEQNTVWHPRDGVYAHYGKSYADFKNQCMKSGDAVIALAKSWVSIGAERCQASRILLKPPTTVELDVACSQSETQTVNDVGSRAASEPSGETVTLWKGHEDGLLLVKSRAGENRVFTESLTYCPDAAQRAYADSKKAK